MENICYKFANFRLETDTRSLYRANEPVHLANRPFEILSYLIEHRARVVSRAELLENFWDGHDVYDDALRKTVSTLRHALNDTETPWRFIDTLRGKGFRFVGEVEEVQRPKLEDQNSQSGTGLITRSAAMSPPAPLWRSRPVFISAFAVFLILTVSFAVKTYLPRTARNDRRSFPKIQALAVLPIRNLTGDPGNDYLSDGLSEGLINELSRHSDLKVISRASSFSFKNKDIDPREIAGKLGVEAILEGSLRKSSDELRFDVSLVSADTGEVIWTSDAAKSSLGSIFTAQNKIACDLLAKIEAGMCSKTGVARNVDSRAYSLYLQGIQVRRDLTLDGMTKAVSLFEQALNLAPDFAEAHEAIATTYVIMEANSLVAPHSVAAKAEQHANEALKIDEDSVDALLVLSETKASKNYDLELREALLRQAVEKNPNHVRARMWLANLLTVQGKFDEAETQLLYAQQIDPLSPGVRLNLSELYLYWRKPNKAVEQSDLLLDRDAGDVSAIRIKARAYLQIGDVGSASEFWNRLPDSEKDDTAIEFLIKSDKTSEARIAIAKLAASEKAKTSPYRIGCLYAELGDSDKSFAWLEKAFTARQADLLSVKVDPAIDPLRMDPRYFGMIQRLNLTD